jgi:glutaredoxin
MPEAGVPAHGSAALPHWGNARRSSSSLELPDFSSSLRSASSSGAASSLARAMSRPQVQLLTRAGCTICVRVHAQLAELAAELDFELSSVDVDAVAAQGDNALRAEFGDRLPVVLLDGREHSYWEVDEARLRADLA